MNDLKVSIIIPVYNAERYLRETLNSIIHQTYKNIEVICVDDGSSDLSLEILKDFQSMDSRLHILNQKNQYAGIARNNGMAQATGEYVLFLDADDIFEKNMIAHLLGKARKFDPDIIIFGYYRFPETIKSRRPVKYNFKEKLCTPEEIKENIFQYTLPVPWNKFIKREFIIQSGLKYQNSKVNNDIFFNCLIVAEAQKIYFTKKRLVNYRINNINSITGNVNRNKSQLAFADEFIKIYQELLKRGKYNTFSKSFEKLVTDHTILHLKRIDSYKDYLSFVEGLKNMNYFNQLSITESSKAVQENSYKETLQSIIGGDINEGLAKLYYETQKSSVDKSSVDYIIGHTILKKMRLSF